MQYVVSLSSELGLIEILRVGRVVETQYLASIFADRNAGFSGLKDLQDTKYNLCRKF